MTVDLWLLALVGALGFILGWFTGRIYQRSLGRPS